MQMIHMRAVRTPIRIKSFAFNFCFMLCLLYTTICVEVSIY